jgi:hypothetical protein
MRPAEPTTAELRDARSHGVSVEVLIGGNWWPTRFHHTSPAARMTVAGEWTDRTGRIYRRPT